MKQNEDPLFLRPSFPFPKIKNRKDAAATMARWAENLPISCMGRKNRGFWRSIVGGKWGLDGARWCEMVRDDFLM